MSRENPKSNNRKVLDRDRYIPGHLLRLANGMSRSASRVYLALFDVGIIEWRILSILSIESYVTAQRICEEIDLDRAAASRSLRVLEAASLVRVNDDVTDNRKRPITLTDAGKALHERILAIATKRQKLLMRGFSAADTETLLDMLGRMETNIEDVYSHDAQLIGAMRDGKLSRNDTAVTTARRGSKAVAPDD
jgi:DNA-binding MarR family transcriptional regulator